MPFFSEDKRIIYKRKIKGFWDEYRRNKIGLVGLALLTFFIFIGVFAPYIAPYSIIRPPVVASKFAMPEWVSILPQYADLPRTMNLNVFKMEATQNSSFVDVSRGENITLSYVGESLGDVGEIQLTLNFNYSYTAPDEFRLDLSYHAKNIIKTKYTFTITLIICDGTEIELTSRSSTLNSTFSSLTMSSTSAEFRRKFDPNMQINPAKIMFANKGNYSLNLRVAFQPTSTNAHGVITITSGALTIYGSLHGVLGTDSFGRDVFSIILYGAGTSITVGILTAILTTSMAIVIGTIAGYFGGIVDEVLMRFVDIMLCIPFFILLLALSFNYRLNIYVIIVLISIFWWPGPSRTIRSRVLALKESVFIESAKAAGATSFYIIRRHLLPNIFPLAMAALVLFVPAGILMEAALSFLGFGDINTITWGRILSDARATGAFTSLAWWVVVPPGLAITLLCLSFVFIGHALDSIVNPRLRRR
jgi:peptide/nickel transport system permease protein